MNGELAVLFDRDVLSFSFQTEFSGGIIRAFEDLEFYRPATIVIGNLIDPIAPALTDGDVQYMACPSMNLYFYTAQIAGSMAHPHVSVNSRLNRRFVYLRVDRRDGSRNTTYNAGNGCEDNGGLGRTSAHLRIRNLR